MLERPKLPDVAFEGSFSRNAFRVAFRVDGALVCPAGEPPQPRAFLAVPSHQIALISTLQVGDRAEAVSRELRRAHRTDTVDEANRFLREERWGLSLPQNGEAAGFVEIRGNLCEEFVGGQAYGYRDAEFAFDVGGKPRQHLCRAHAVQSLGTGQIEEGLVDRQWFDQWREVEHGLADLTPDLNVFRHVWLDHHGIGTASLGFEHRHCRVNAVSAGHIACGGDHATLAAADDDRLVGKRRVITLFDGGVECVAIDVSNAERGCVRMAYQSRRPTGWTAHRVIVGVGEAIPTEIHGTSPSHVSPPRTTRPLSMSEGSRPASPAKAPISCSSEAI